LIHLEAAVLVALAMIGLFGDADRTADVCHGLSLSQDNFSFTQFGEDLFNGVPETWRTALHSARP